MSVTPWRMNERTIVAAITAANVPLLPLYANMIAVLASTSEFARERSYPLALVVILTVVTLFRWRRGVGMLVNGIVAAAAVIALAWSDEPLSYLAYAGYLLIGVVILHALIYWLVLRGRTG